MLDGLVARARRLAARDDRIILGIAGSPGAGKSTLAGAILDELTRQGDLPAALVPMDGFHLSDSALDRLGRRRRKGSIDTFDGDGYLALLRRLRADRQHTIWAPGFERDLEQPIAGTIPVGPEIRLVITEGNYLLADAHPWPAVRAELAEVWFCQLDAPLRRYRLIRRHVRFGKSDQAARSWVTTVDDPNAELIEAGRYRADLIVEMAGLEPVSPSPHRSGRRRSDAGTD
jgi:pantothenate kinase